MYLLKLLNQQGMSQQQLSVIAHNIIVSRILYALLAWGGFLSVKLKNKINAFFKRLKRFGYVDCVITIDDLIDHSDHELQIIPCTTCSHSHHIVQLICIYVVILSGCLNIVLICIRNHSLFELCMNILNDVVLVLFCSCYVFIVSLISFASYIIAKYMHDVRLSHPNKDYLLTYWQWFRSRYSHWEHLSPSVTHRVDDINSDSVSNIKCIEPQLDIVVYCHEGSVGQSVTMQSDLPNIKLTRHFGEVFERYTSKGVTALFSISSRNLAA